MQAPVRPEEEVTVAARADDDTPTWTGLPTDWIFDDQGELIRQVVADAPIGMCLVAPDGTFLAANPALCQFFGLDEATLVHRTWQELTHADDVEADLEQVRRVLDGETDGYRMTKRFLYADGSVRVGDLSVGGVRDADGGLQFFISQIVDVTAQATAEAELARSRELFRLLAENASDVVIRSRAGIAEWVSPSSLDVLGWQPGDVIGTDLINLVHADDQKRVLRAREQSGRTPSPTLRYRVLHGDGSWHWVEALVRTLTTAAGADDGAVESWRDVDEETAARNALRESQELLRATIDTLIDPWVQLAAVRNASGQVTDFRFADANSAACLANGLPYAELVGTRLLVLFPDHGPNGLFDEYVRVVETGHPLSIDDVPFPDRRHGGTTRRFDNRAVRVGDGISFTWRDVTERFDARQREVDRARRDPLTGLPNRTQLMEYIDRLAATPDPRKGDRAILYCDVDGFKPVNDTWGHAVGDDVLRTVARRIAESVRAGDLVARIGGDEFIVILDEVRTKDEAIAVAEKIRSSVARPIEMGGGMERITISIGLALGHSCGDPDQCLQTADSALYQAKEQGRDRVVAAS